MSHITNARLLLLENTSISLSTDHAHTLHLQLDISSSAFSIPCDCSAPSSLCFHLGKLSDERVQKDMCAAFDDGVRSHCLVAKSIVDPAFLDCRLVSLVQSICRKFLGQKKLSGPATRTHKDAPVGYQDYQDHQDLATSTLLYKSAAVESRENGVILPLESGRSKGLLALQEIYESLAERYAGRLLEGDEPARPSSHS